MLDSYFLKELEDEEVRIYFAVGLLWPHLCPLLVALGSNDVTMGVEAGIQEQTDSQGRRKQQ